MSGMAEKPLQRVRRADSVSLDSIIPRWKHVKTQRTRVLRRLARTQEGTPEHEELSRRLRLIEDELEELRSAYSSLYEQSPPGHP